MRALIQRVSRASVTVNENQVDQISTGILVLLGIEEADDFQDIEWLVKKISNLRIFPDENGVMNVSVIDARGSFLVISQFTLHASTKKGNRPSYIKAARPETAIPLYEKFIAHLSESTSLKVGSGVFGAHMDVELVNDGPVTLLLDSKNRE